MAGYLSVNVYVEFTKIREPDVLRYLGAGVSRLAWLEQAGYHNVNAMVPMIQFIRKLYSDDQIHASDTILMVGEGKGYLLPVRYLLNYTPTGYRWLAQAARHAGDTERIAEDLLEKNIRFILFNYGYVSGNGAMVRRLREESLLTFFLMDKFAQQYARPIYNHRGIILLEVVERKNSRHSLSEHQSMYRRRWLLARAAAAWRRGGHKPVWSHLRAVLAGVNADHQA